jgi:signal peptidase II
MQSSAARRIVAFLIAFGLFGLDRWTKSLVESGVGAYDTKTVIPGFFNIVRSENTGVAFGMFSDSSTQTHNVVLVALSLVAILLLGGMLWRIDRLDTPSAAGLTLILGGAMGNVYDRVHAGRVTDFLDFFVGAWHWYTFNVADSYICVGAGFLILSMLFSRNRKEVRA